MRNKIVGLCALLLFSIGLTGLYAQESIPASGGNASGTGGSISYTVGQVVYKTNSGTTGSEAQGVQQPYEISVVSVLDEPKGITLKCSAYPNPVADFLKLTIENLSTVSLTYQLYDVNAKLLDNKKIEGNETRISMSNFSAGTYFLKVTNSNNLEVKSFKIIKN
ncbi:MAG: T9SS type A sorting domain-containing protein [bacterium]